MKKESVYKIKLGIFVTLGIIIFFSGIYFIGETKKLFSDTFRVSALFNDISGLQVGNNVRFAGINVGTVEYIQILNDTSVKVDMLIDKDTQKFIKKDAKVIIGTDGLMGNKILNITPGTPGFAVIENNDRIGTTVPVSIDEMLLKLKVTGDNAALITGDLAAILNGIRNGEGTAGKLLSDKKFANNIDNIVSNVNSGSEGFKNTFDDKFAENLSDIMVNVKQSTVELKKVVKEAQNSWLLGSFFGGSSSDDEDELKKEELQKKEKDTNEVEKKRLIRVKQIYDDEVLREKNEKKLLEQKEKLKRDSLKK